MSYAPNVQVRTTIESQRLQIISALTERQIDLPKMVDAALDSALKDDALAESIRRDVAEQVYATIRDEIKEAIRRAFWSDEMRARIANAVIEGMKP